MNILPFPLRLALIGLLLSVTLLSPRAHIQPEGELSASAAQTRHGAAPALRLSPPAFLGVARAKAMAQSEAGFLFKDAGISAYTHLSHTLSLSTLRPLLRTVERESDDSLIGSLPPPGYANLRELGESADVHVYIRKDGWLVVYLLAQTPTARIIDWANYDNDKLGQTTLERTLLWLAEQSGASRPDVGFYHFQFPAAGALTLVADREDRAASRDTFQVKLPANLPVFERSWASGTTYFAICRLEQKELTRMAGALETWKLQAGIIDPQDFPTDRLIEFSLYNESAKYRSYCGVAVLHGGVGS